MLHKCQAAAAAAAGGLPLESLLTGSAGGGPRPVSPRLLEVPFPLPVQWHLGRTGFHPRHTQPPYVVGAPVLLHGALVLLPWV